MAVLLIWIFFFNLFIRILLHVLGQLTTCIIKFFFSQSCLSFEFSLQIVAMPIWFKMVFLKLKIKFCYQVNTCTISYYTANNFFSIFDMHEVKIHIQNAWHKEAIKIFTCLNMSNANLAIKIIHLQCTFFTRINSHIFSF